MKKANYKKNPLPNPKYDAMIDPSTGTKKQLVLIDFSKIGKTFEDAYSKDSKEWKYPKLSKLPYNARFLFVPHNEQE
ncbi:hypothetical protein NPL7_03385 [Metamycoplasma hyosynoviae]|uniref:Uncharacterized protein n=1 Tax=Metamycoplasma hyosynoviae TaxID=29559 RepID=A0A9Q9BRN7_9BACT|nr:hypothetical protein [Metamycoplasma hyosynoviae]KDE41525.1 hypothetical protein NPL7_03385 [Metamycoplasma hyosynoviae]KDE43023.1 hypothetical protein NPL3_00480 [Metamycoplasma hyosynoviae]KDE43614.1 hypothetical protein NPL5_02170 [Metamycoplasma hyosynoviae]KDE44310.1 hypothetical protein NPL6_01860 [Metamycoplasma hyosynoviae]MDC8900853.1 hypothetical protein [Metamycoplasma hyosynoviae]